MFKAKLIFLFVLVCSFCAIEPCAAPQSGRASRHLSSFYTPDIENLPGDAIMNILSFVQPPKTKCFRLVGGTVKEVEFAAADYKKFVRDPSVNALSDAQLFRHAVDFLTPNCAEKPAIMASLKTEEQKISPEAFRVYTYVKQVDAHRQACMQRKEKRAQSSTWQRFSGTLGGVCCRRA